MSVQGGLHPGGSLSREGLHPGGQGGLRPEGTVNRMTHRFKNITFPQLRWRTVIKRIKIFMFKEIFLDITEIFLLY